MWLTRGNHEAKSMNKIYGFDGEVSAKGHKKEGRGFLLDAGESTLSDAAVER